MKTVQVNDMIVCELNALEQAQLGGGNAFKAITTFFEVVGITDAVDAFINGFKEGFKEGYSEQQNKQ